MEALQEVHAHEIVHMDIKPENTIIYDANNGILKVIDFGLGYHPKMDA